MIEKDWDELPEDVKLWCLRERKQKDEAQDAREAADRKRREATFVPDPASQVKPGHRYEIPIRDGETLVLEQTPRHDHMGRLPEPEREDPR